MKRQVHFSRKKRQLARLSEALHDAIQQQSEDLILRLRKKINRLLVDLAGVVSRPQLKGLLGAVAVVFGLGATSHSAIAQENNFLAGQANAFGLTGDTATMELWEMVDLDGDGDLDILAGSTPADYGSYEGQFKFYENVGDKDNPSFAAPQVNPFGLGSIFAFGAPTFGDLDGDGDLDLLVGEYYGNIKYYENTGSKTNPAFSSPQSNPYGLVIPGYFNGPEFADIDADGDLDLMVLSYDTSGLNFEYFENIGTPQLPQFLPAQSNPFGLMPSGETYTLEFQDMDGDGDLDILAFGYGSNAMEYYENVGTKNSPSFSAPLSNPFNFVPADNNMIFGAMGDVDNDGDVDLLSGNYYGESYFYENVPTIGIDEQSFKVAVYPNPTDGVLNLSSAERIQKVEVFDLTGRLVFFKQWPESRLNLGDLPAGMYRIHLSDEDNKISTQPLSVF